MANSGDVVVDVAPAESSTALVGSDSAPPRKQANSGAPAWAFIVTGVLTIITAIMIVLFVVELNSRDRETFNDVVLTASPVSPRGYHNVGSLAAGSGEWVAKAALPYTASDMSSVSFGGVILLLGGLSNNTVLDTVALYDPTFETLNASFTVMPTPRYRFGAAVAGGTLYVVGGYSAVDGPALDSCDAFTFATHSWAACPSMSLPRGDIAAAAGNTTDGAEAVFVFGGYSTGFDASVSGTLTERLVAGGSSWTTVAAMPTSRGDLAAVALTIHNEIYVVGGWSPITEKFLPTVEAYLPASDSWLTLPSMPAARGDKAVAIHHHHLVVMGGEVWSGATGPCPWDPSITCDVNEIPTHDVYTLSVDGHGVESAADAAELTTGHWVAHAPIPEARFRFTAATAGDAIFTFGGHAEGLRTTDTVDAFYDVEHPEVWVHTNVAEPHHDHGEEEEEDHDHDH